MSINIPQGRVYHNKPASRGASRSEEKISKAAKGTGKAESWLERLGCFVSEQLLPESVIARLGAVPILDWIISNQYNPDKLIPMLKDALIAVKSQTPEQVKHLNEFREQVLQDAQSLLDYKENLPETPQAMFDPAKIPDNIYAGDNLRIGSSESPDPAITRIRDVTAMQQVISELEKPITDQFEAIHGTNLEEKANSIYQDNNPAYTPGTNLLICQSIASLILSLWPKCQSPEQKKKYKMLDPKYVLRKNLEIHLKRVKNKRLTMAEKAGIHEIPNQLATNALALFIWILAFGPTETVRRSFNDITDPIEEFLEGNFDRILAQLDRIGTEKEEIEDNFEELGERLGLQGERLHYKRMPDLNCFWGSRFFYSGSSWPVSQETREIIDEKKIGRYTQPPEMNTMQGGEDAAGSESGNWVTAANFITEVEGNWVCVEATVKTGMSTIVTGSLADTLGDGRRGSSANDREVCFVNLPEGTQIAVNNECGDFNNNDKQVTTVFGPNSMFYPEVEQGKHYYVKTTVDVTECVPDGRIAKNGAPLKIYQQKALVESKTKDIPVPQEEAESPVIDVEKQNDEAQAHARKILGVTAAMAVLEVGATTVLSYLGSHLWNNKVGKMYSEGVLWVGSKLSGVSVEDLKESAQKVKPADSRV